MNRPTPLRARAAATAMRVAAAAFALLAAFDVRVPPAVPGARRALLRIVAVDRSRSVARDAVSSPGAIREAASGAMRGLGDADRAAVLAFGRSARLAAAATTPGRAAASVSDVAIDATATRLGAALHAAAAIRASHADLACEVIVRSDLVFTDTDADRVAAARALRESGGAALRFEALDGGAPAGIAALAGPGRVRAGEPFVLEATGRAPAGGSVVLSADGEAIEARPVSGPFRVQFARAEPRPGFRVFEASVRGTDARAEARVVVASEGAVVVLAAQDSPYAEECARAFGPTTCVVRSGPATGGGLPALAAADVVVLHDVDAASLPSARQEEIVGFVRRGGGLVLTGGPRAYAAGGWGGSAVDGASPLRATPPDDRGRHVFVAIDASGSMGEAWGAAGRKADVVAGAAAALVRASPADAVFTVRRFRGALVPQDGGRDGSRDAALAAISAVPESAGPTRLLPPIDEALERASATPQADVTVLFSDGQSSESAEEIGARLRALLAGGNRVFVVCPGVADPRAPLVAAAAAAGVEVREARDAASLGAVVAQIGARLGADDPFVGPSDLRVVDAEALSAAAVPSSARRRNAAWPTKDARRLVVAADGSAAGGSAAGGTVVAVREEGNGRIAAMTVPAAGSEWVDGGGARLAAALARLVARRATGDLRAERTRGGMLLRAAGSASGATHAEFSGRDLAARRVPLRPETGGLLFAELEDGAEPDVVRAIDRGSGGDEGGRELASAGVDRPAPEEWRGSTPVAAAHLAALAAAAAEPPGRPRDLRPWFAAAAVALIAASAWAAARGRAAS